MISDLSKQFQSKNSKRHTPDRSTAQLLNDTLVALDSFKATSLVIFAEIAKEKMDQLYAAVNEENR